MSRANEPAFPREVQKYFAGRDDLNYTERDKGLTIREEFAKAAMQGILAGNHPVCRGPEHGLDRSVAQVAIEFADALIAELAKPKELPLDEHGNTIEPYHALGEFLHSIGWKAPCDAQWTKLRDNAQKIAALASAVQP